MPRCGNSCGECPRRPSCHRAGASGRDDLRESGSPIRCRSDDDTAATHLPLSGSGDAVLSTGSLVDARDEDVSDHVPSTSAPLTVTALANCTDGDLLEAIPDGRAVECRCPVRRAAFSLAVRSAISIDRLREGLQDPTEGIRRLAFAAAPKPARPCSGNSRTLHRRRSSRQSRQSGTTM